MHEAPKLLVEWASPWEEFVSSIRPALGHSEARLAGEARTGLFPMRGMLLSWAVQAVFLALLIWLPAKLASMRPYVPPTPPKYDVIYFSPDELPKVLDAGGAQSGRSGKAGGKEAYHRTQTIRVARGSQSVEKVVDAPDLKLPISKDPVANLLAFKSNPGPPPTEGVKSSRTTPELLKNAIAPPPETTRDSRSTPSLASSIIAPPPSNITPRNRQMMGLSTTIVAPAPADVPRDQSHSVIAMTSNVIQPAPDVSRDPPPLRGPNATNTLVVPPPVSAPARETAQSAKVNLPLPGVIAPPPSQVSKEQRTQTGASLMDPNVVPPPAQIGGRSQDRRAIPGAFGTNQIVPPPPSVTNGSALNGGGSGHNDRAGGFGSTLSAGNVVPPPPSMSGGSIAGGGSGGSHTGLGSLANSAVVPPPPSFGAAGGSLTGRGSGNRGLGLGGVFDNGSVTAPPTSAGSGAGSGVVLSSQPGTSKGVPGNGSAGAMAMSPSGGNKPGIGGSGDGSGIGRGNGPGSGLSGEGSGAAKTGTGRGSDVNARGGTSPYPGTGGAGSGTNGRPPVPGVSVQGGHAAIVNLPSFGADGNDPQFPERAPSGGKGVGAFDIIVEGSSKAGGAFNYYGLLKGDKVYTKYLPTSSGTVVMQFTDTSSALHAHGIELTAPTALRTDLPAGLIRHRLDIACVLDRSGLLRNMQVLKAEPGAPAARVIAALSHWKFTPAFRGSEPVEVNAIFGFNVNTN